MVHAVLGSRVGRDLDLEFLKKILDLTRVHADVFRQLCLELPFQDFELHRHDEENQEQEHHVNHGRELHGDFFDLCFLACHVGVPVLVLLLLLVLCCGKLNFVDEDSVLSADAHDLLHFFELGLLISPDEERPF